MSGEGAATARVEPAAPGGEGHQVGALFDLAFVFAFIHLNTLAVEALDLTGLLGMTAIFVSVAILPGADPAGPRRGRSWSSRPSSSPRSASA